LDDRSAEIEIAFIFGSFAQGAESPESDIDLFVVGDISGRELAQLLGPAKERLGRELNPVRMTASEFRDKLQKGDAFLNRLLDEPLIFLIGGEDELRELAG
jgi:predicted nucleotidyltransferase